MTLSSNCSSTTLEMSSFVQPVVSVHNTNSADDTSLNPQPVHDVSDSTSSTDYSAIDIPTSSQDRRVIIIGYNPAEARPNDQKLGVSKEISTVTKLLFTVSVAAILLNANNDNAKEINARVACVEKTVHLLAIILMIVGIYVQVERPNVSKWLQRIGHLICLISLMLIRTPLLELPHAFFWLPPLSIFSGSRHY